MARGPFSSVPKLIALGGVLPLLLLLLWLTWHVAQRNREVASWPQVLAQVVQVTDDRVQLQFFWRGDLVRGDVKKAYTFAKLAPYETIELLANPSNPAELSAAGFGDVWAGTIALGIADAFLGAVLLFMLHEGDAKMPKWRAASSSPQATRRRDESLPGAVAKRGRPGRHLK